MDRSLRGAAGDPGLAHALIVAALAAGSLRGIVGADGWVAYGNSACDAAAIAAALEAELAD